MGRRSVNTTKNGRFMNPTDQARKEARKRELKKNKKQRMAVRQAVLKSKDPLQLLEETALYDKQEYDPSVQASLNERVIQEKRKKLLETFDRLVLLYRKENAEYANRLKAAREDYDKRRHGMMLYYEQVKLAERVKASEIPLPKLPQSQIGLITSDIPLPPGVHAKGILKRSLGAPGLPPSRLPAGCKPPGPPPGTPPDLSDSDGEEDEQGDVRQRRIRFIEPDIAPAVTNPETSQVGLLSTPKTGFSGFSLQPSQIPLPPPAGLPAFNKVMLPGFPGAPQPSTPRITFGNISGKTVLSAPPSLHPRDPLDNPDLGSGPAHQTNAGGSANLSSSRPAGGAPTGTTIEAKPQLKNLIGDATRFVPTAIKVRRTVRDASTGRLVSFGGGVSAGGGSGFSGPSGPNSEGKYAVPPYGRGVHRADDSSGLAGASATSKDDAYDEFMREMEGLL